MSNSKLVNYTRLSPNCNKPRNHRIDKITIHHMAGNLTVEQCGAVFAPTSRQASSNYGIGSDGRVGMYVEECNRSWCSSNAENDHRAVTIEVANDGGAPDWHVSDKALSKLIELCADICKRNGITKLNYTGDKTGNLTMHKWFASTGCPGPYLESKFAYIAEQVNKRLSAGSEAKKLYRVRKSWTDEKSQLGAFEKLENAKKACKAGYTVYDSNGKAVYSVKSTAKSYTKGTEITLKNKTLYVSATAKSGIKKSGTYYLYDGAVVNGRMRITDKKIYCGKNPVGQYVTGWIDKGEVK